MIKVKWEEQPWHLSNAEIAKRIGCCSQSVYLKRKALAMGNHPRAGICFDSVDWTLVNREVAKLVGCSIQTARVERNRRGLPKGTKGRKEHGDKGKPRKFKLKDFDLTLTDTQLGRKLGITRERCRQIRKQMGQPSSRELHPTLNASQIDPAKTVGENAAIFGCSKASVYAVARRCGIRLPRPIFIKPTKYAWESVDWSNRTCEIARNLGVHHNFVSRMRRKLAPDTLDFSRI